MDIPEKIGKYTVLQKLGEGASGCVVKAEQEVIHRIVALKILFSDLTQQNPLIIKRFKREARLASSLLHPGIVPIFEIDEYKGMHYYTMQYIRGTPMLDHIKNDTLSLQERLNVLAELCSAVALAHSKGIVHRDLKPHNVILTPEQHPVILDFGIAKSLQDEEQMTRVGNILGSAHYMAPEQAMTTEIGAYTDVFALGVMMYEFITAQRPFQGINVKDLVLKRILYAKNPDEHRPLTMLSIKPDIPEELNTIVFRCMEANPKNRYKDAGELSDALHDFMGQISPSQTSGITSVINAHKAPIHITKSYILPILVGIVISMLFVFAGFFLYHNKNQELANLREFQKQGSQKLNNILENLQKEIMQKK